MSRWGSSTRSEVEILLVGGRPQAGRRPAGPPARGVQTGRRPAGGRPEAGRRPAAGRPEAGRRPAIHTDAHTRTHAGARTQHTHAHAYARTHTHTCRPHPAQVLPCHQPVAALPQRSIWMDPIDSPFYVLIKVSLSNCSRIKWVGYLFSPAHILSQVARTAGRSGDWWVARGPRNRESRKNRGNRKKKTIKSWNQRKT